MALLENNVRRISIFYISWKEILNYFAKKNNLICLYLCFHAKPSDVNVVLNYLFYHRNKQLDSFKNAIIFLISSSSVIVA
jgi:hypothetical protein